MSQITPDALTPDEPVTSRSRTFSPDVVAAVASYMTGKPEVPANAETGEAGSPAIEKVQNLGIGTFDTEGAARSALVAINKLLSEPPHKIGPFSGTVRQVEGDKWRAILLNKPAKKKTEKAAEQNGNTAQAAQPKPAQSSKR